MNIWILNHYAVPMKYYPHARPHYFAKYIQLEGNDVTVFAASTVHNSNINLISNKEKYISEDNDNIHYVYLKTSTYGGNGFGRVKNMFQYMMAMYRNSSKFKKPDVIYAMSAHPLACIAGIKLAKKYNCKCIVDIADLWPQSFIEYNILKKNSIITKLMFLGEKWIYKKADKIVFTMQGGKDYLVEKGWNRCIDLKKVFYVNNGVDLEEFNYNRDNYKIDDSDITNKDIYKIVYVGSIRKVNNLDKLIDVAIELNKRSLNNIKLLIYGDGSEKSILEDKVSCEGLTNFVFKGKVEKKYIPYIISNADINILHGKSTNIMKYGCSPNKLFDYFAAGKPILSDLQPEYDLIKEAKCGLVVDNETSDILDAILYFYNIDSGKYEMMCENSHKYSIKYNFKHLAADIYKIVMN